MGLDQDWLEPNSQWLTGKKIYFFYFFLQKLRREQELKHVQAQSYFSLILYSLSLYSKVTGFPGLLPSNRIGGKAADIDTNSKEGQAGCLQ